jgi:NADPH:quinone reductase-like Zn-dependent oxidoreductase
MEAVVCRKSGPPEILELKEVQKPFPEDKEILIKVHAATVTIGDVILRKLNPVVAFLLGVFGVRKMKIPGVEFAGDITAIGEDVTQFKVGDKVFGTTTGLRYGANAEYVCVPEKSKQGVLGLMPMNATYGEAAALPVGGMTALFILKKSDLQAGDKVLVYGASGSVGSYAVQLAKQFYDAEVTGVCSTGNIELVKSLGADEVIDYTRQKIQELGNTYDVVFDAVGKLTASGAKTMMNENGKFLTVRKPTRETAENLSAIKAMFEAGKIKPVIDKRFRLEEIVEAHRYVETGRKRGNVVIPVTETGGLL